MLSKSGEFIKGFDGYGQPVTLNFMGDETFKTVPGGAITVAIILIWFALSITKFQRLINREDWTVNT